MLLELAWFTRGWVNYFGLADIAHKVVDYDCWIRRRLRAYLWKQWKCVGARFDALVLLGISGGLAWRWANSRRGCWRVAGSQILSFSCVYLAFCPGGFKTFCHLVMQVKTRFAPRSNQRHHRLINLRTLPVT